MLFLCLLKRQNWYAQITKCLKFVSLLVLQIFFVSNIILIVSVLCQTRNPNWKILQCEVENGSWHNDKTIKWGKQPVNYVFLFSFQSSKAQQITQCLSSLWRLRYLHRGEQMLSWLWSIYLILLFLLLLSEGLLSLLLHSQLSGLFQHPLMVGHCLHLVDPQMNMTVMSDYRLPHI